jgi:hypothetical protein
MRLAAEEGPCDLTTGASRYAAVAGAGTCGLATGAGPRDRRGRHEARASSLTAGGYGGERGIGELRPRAASAPASCTTSPLAGEERRGEGKCGRWRCTGSRGEGGGERGKKKNEPFFV